jgi:hypothetical protein
MFRTAPVTEPTHDVMEHPADDLIPLSVLELDLPAPTTGWLIELDRRHIQVVSDDIGRPSISRDDARTLIAEHHEAEARNREALQRQEQKAIADDRAFRARLPKGLPWYEFPDGVSPAEAWQAAELAAQPKRTSLLEEALSNSDTLTYHPLPSAPDEE